MGDLRPMSPGPRQAPYSIESEQAVLGGILRDNRAWTEAAARVVETDFYRADHQLIWRGLSELIAAKTPCDFVTLTEHFRARGALDEVGGMSYLGSLCDETPSSANVAAYARLVREQSVLRTLIIAGGDIAEMGYRPGGRDIDELLADAHKRVMDLNVARSKEGDLELLSDSVGAWHSDYLARKSDENPPGLQTGFANLDQLLIGLEPGDLMITAGATGMGKTVFGLTIADHVATHAGASAGISLEMPKKQWLTRLVASRGRIPLQRLRDPRQCDAFFDDEVVRALQGMNRLPFYVSDQSGQTIHQIRSRVMGLQDRLKGGLKFLLVDYLQLIVGDRHGSDTRASELDAIGRALKRLAKDAGIAILGLAQVNDDPNKRDNKRPRLGDLRESKGLTQDADIVCLLYRDEYHDKNTPHKGIVEVDVAKQRNGKLDVAELQWLGGYCSMSDYTGPSSSERIAAAKPKGEGNEKRGMQSPKTLLPKNLQP